MIAIKVLLRGTKRLVKCRSCGLCTNGHPVQNRYFISALFCTMTELRTAQVARKTNETDITVSIALDHEVGTSQAIDVKTGIGFLDHVSLRP